MVKQTLLTVLLLSCLRAEAFSQTYLRFLTNDIVIINTRDADRYKISELIEAINRQNPKVIGVNHLFDLRKEADSIFISRLSKSCPIVLPLNHKNDSAYFKLANCENGLAGITENRRGEIEFIQPLRQDNGKFRDSFEFLILKHFDSTKYHSMRSYLLHRFNQKKKPLKYSLKAKIELICTDTKCFNYLDINDRLEVSPDSFHNKIILIGFLGDDPDIPSESEKGVNAHLIRTRQGKLIHMYDTLILANILSNYVNKEIRPEELRKVTSK